MKKRLLAITALLAMGLSITLQAAQIDFGFPTSDATKNWNSLTSTPEADGSITFSKTQDGITFDLNVAGFNHTNDADIVNSGIQTNVNVFPNGAGAGVSGGASNTRINKGQYMSFTISVSSGAELLDSLAFTNLNIRYEGNANQDNRTLFDNSGNSVLYDNDATPKGNYTADIITGAGLDQLTLATTNSWSLGYAIMTNSTDGVVALGQVSFAYEISTDFVSDYTGILRLGTGDMVGESYTNSPVTWDTTTANWGVGPLATQSAWTNWIDGADAIFGGTTNNRIVNLATNLNVVVAELENDGDSALHLTGISNSLEIVTITNELRTALAKPSRWFNLNDVNVGGTFNVQNVGRITFTLGAGVEAGTDISYVGGGDIAFNGTTTDFTELTASLNGGLLFNQSASDKTLGSLSGNGSIRLNGGNTLTINNITVGGISNVASFTANASSVGNLQMGSGTHNFSINTAAATADQLAIGTGTNIFGGDLIVISVNTNTLSIGDSFKLFDAGAYAGSFSSIVLPTNNLPAGAEFYTDDLGVDGTISVGEPGISYKNVNFTDFNGFSTFTNEGTSTSGSITNGNTVVTLTLSVGDFQDALVNNYSVGLYNTSIQGLKGGPEGKSDFRHDSGLDPDTTDDDEVLKLEVSISSTDNISAVGLAGLNVTDANSSEITDFMDGTTNATMTGSARVTPSDTLSVLDPLTIDNVGGLGSGTWYLEIAARDIPSVTNDPPESRMSFDNITISYGIQVATAFDLWSTQYGLTEGADGDDDGDLVSNLYEYGLGGDPTNSADRGYTATGTADAGGTNYFEYVYAKRTASNSGITYDLEETDNLAFVDFTNDIPDLVVIEGALDADFNAVTNRIPTTDDAARFLKLVIEEN